jgi:alpha-beta hydrolase superfamily lysophospholipase
MLALAGATTGPAFATHHRKTLDGCIRSGPGVAIVKLKVSRRHSIRAAVLGKARRGVVLSNQSDKSLCSWLPFAHTLRKAGYAVLLYDYSWGTYRSEVRAAVRKLKHRRTHRVALLGASQGAKVAILAAGSGVHVAGVVSLSAERYLGAVDIKRPAARIHKPIIFFSSENDPWESAPAARLFYRVCPSAKKQLVMLGGDLHGIDLLSGPDGPSVQERILGFLQDATAPTG